MVLSLQVPFRQRQQFLLGGLLEPQPPPWSVFPTVFRGKEHTRMHRHHPLPHTKGTSIPRGHLHQEGPEADYSPRNKTRDKMPLKNLKITMTKVKQKVGSTN